MSDGNLDAAVLRRTQETLGRYVKKPPLTEKLLSKPPFRFLHDVFYVIIRDTGCFEGLYTADELKFDNIKDRDDKMRFLQKMIDVIKIATGSKIAVRTSKIVAGQEAEKTNELLQLIGEVVEKQSEVDWRAAVVQVVTGGKAIKASEEKLREGKTMGKEKVKEKVNKARPPKVKAHAIKIISPTTKEDKPKKPTAAKSKDREKEKEPTTKANRDVKEKVSRTSKENATKAKVPNTKVGVTRRTSPSPIRVDARKTERKSSIKESTELMPALEASREAQVIGAAKMTKEKSPKELARNGDSLRERINSKPIEKAEPAMDEKQSPKKSAESRKSKSSSSSGRSRRSIASKIGRDENDSSHHQQQNYSPNNTDLLNTLNKEEESAIAAPQPPPLALPTSALSALPNTQSSNDIKRESTFTRENSKDSGSNSQSSLQPLAATAAHAAPVTSVSTSRPRTSLRPPSVRPVSARPGAPRRRDKNIEIILQPNDQQKISGVSVKLETFGDLDDDGENLVIIEDASAEQMVGSNELLSKTPLEGDMLQQQGHLVQQILETQKELVHQNGDGTSTILDKDDLGGVLNGRQNSALHMNNLRDVIQNLTKSVNPFGKLMDFIPEDIDAMQLEMSMWRETYTQAAAELNREKSLTESTTDPMKQQLLLIEDSIKEYADMIDTSRMKVLQNAEKLLKLLTEQ